MAGQLTDADMDQLETWVGTGPKTFTLLYKITRDGCDPAIFHQKCDSQGPTVTVLYNTNGSVFGGYAGQSLHSQSAYINDHTAFLYQLRFSGNQKANKFPVKCSQADYAFHGSPSLGPVFGAGHDLHAFSAKISNNSGTFALNGRLRFKSYDSQGVTTDQINNGHMNVTELEVYKVTDGVRKVKTEKPKEVKPWRNAPELNDKLLDQLKEEIATFKPQSDLDLTDIRVLLLGPVGTGKSSFYNTVNSVFRGRISQRARCGTSAHSITTAYKPYTVGKQGGSRLQFRLCDTRGLEVSQGLDLLECNFLLDGHVPEHYEFNPATPITPETPGFIHKPGLADKVHCVLFVLEANTIDDLPTKLVEKMNSFQKLMNQKGIPQAVLLTKVDVACTEVAQNVSSVFRNTNVEKVVDTVAKLLGLPRNNVLPVKNYENEVQLEAATSALALLALRQALYFTEDFLEDVVEKRASVKAARGRGSSGGSGEGKGERVEIGSDSA
ncbi:interferon-induced protein 44-like [Mya arenaria]|uniref:interferon-induced protein 44-like n=1 Tax=Mya arenaria TaxID=6604 RepID=UPI0022E10A86|nr:interferon-induced protein 44-like [Mya arenaria]